MQQTDIPSNLRQMVDLLVDEEARQEDSTTGLCMEYFLKNDILQYLVTVSEKEDNPVGIREETIRTVASMIDLLDDRFLVHNAVHKPTIKLLRFCVLDDSELYSDDLVDLMYIICSKIHGFPALLNIFFHDKLWLTTPQKSSKDQDSHEYEFLLFTYLLRFVHREGRSGDFARTGLLFLMEMAKDQLGNFIYESDFSTIMAAGLGALYSQLPRKLVVQNETDQIYSNPTSYLLGQDLLEESTYSQFPSGLGIEYSNSPEFKYQLDSFLKLLEFCQDVLNRCPNREICISLLKSVKSTFLENILYPSMLECSDMDGSSVAVITYLDLILQTVQQSDLSKVLVGYLMDDEINTSQGSIFEGIDDLCIEDTTPTKSSTYHFTLKDLVFDRLESKSQPTVIATLKLLKTLITKHCEYSLDLISFDPDINKKPTIISHHLKEVELYFSLISAIDAEHANDILSSGYEEYLRDLEMAIDNDWCYQNAQPNLIADVPDTRQESPKIQRRRSFKYGQRFEDIAKEQEEEKKRQECLRHGSKKMIRHRVRSTDRLLQILLNLLSHFFTQSSELNLALTGVISALALCPYRNLEGWITFSENDRTSKNDILVLNSGSPSAAVSKKQVQQQDIFAIPETRGTIDDDDDDDDRSIDFGQERGSKNKTKPTFFKSYPPFFTLLRTLTQQVEHYRSEVFSFDKLLEERREALVKGDSVLALDKRVMTPSSSLTTTTSARRPSVNPVYMNNNRRPSILRPTNDLPTPTMSPSSSVPTAMGSPYINTVLNNPVAPFTLHVKKTLHTKIQPLFPSYFIVEQAEPILNLDEEDEYTFAPKNTVPSRLKKADKNTEITLSMLLNNVVILQESIKELVALIQVRRSLGIDRIEYV